jgi:hypothetical protein
MLLDELCRTLTGLEYELATEYSLVRGAHPPRKTHLLSIVCACVCAVSSVVFSHLLIMVVDVLWGT